MYTVFMSVVFLSVQLSANDILLSVLHFLSRSCALVNLTPIFTRETTFVITCVHFLHAIFFLEMVLHLKENKFFPLSAVLFSEGSKTNFY